MYIKKWPNFIKESFGLQVQKMADNNPELKNIINGFLVGIDPKLNMASAVDSLDDTKKGDIKSAIEKYKSGESRKSVSTSTKQIQKTETNPKKIFQILLKVITALGKKEEAKTKWNKNTEDWIYYYEVENVNMIALKNIANRFQSISRYVEKIDYTLNHIDIYFGIKTDNTFNFGFSKEKDFNLHIGSFDLNASNFKFLLLLDSPSAWSLKKDLVNMDINKIKMVSKIKKAMNSFQISAQKKSFDVIEDNILSFGFYGIGVWNDTTLDPNYLQTLREKVKNYLLQFNWADKIKIVLNYSEFWVYLNIKLK